MHCFLRLNGKTGHNDPNRPRDHVPNEPPRFPKKAFNYLDLCLEMGFVRIGWPDVGDLRKADKADALCDAYSLATVKPHVREYLLTFARLPEGAVILVPDKRCSGDVYIGEVVGPYHYQHAVPDEPYECAHRLPVVWDRDADGAPVLYRASELGIRNRGGFWTRGFQVLDECPSGRIAIPLIERARARRRQASSAAAPSAR